MRAILKERVLQGGSGGGGGGSGGGSQLSPEELQRFFNAHEEWYRSATLKRQEVRGLRGRPPAPAEEAAAVCGAPCAACAWPRTSFPA
jgi:hypothetical protein